MANQIYSSIHSGADIDEQISFVKDILPKRLQGIEESLANKADDLEVVKTSERNQPNGFLGLDKNGKIPEGLVNSGGGSGGTEVIIDAEMSDTSENPVQNKVVKAYIDDETTAIRNEHVTKIEFTEYIHVIGVDFGILTDRVTILENKSLQTEQDILSQGGAIDQLITDVMNLQADIGNIETALDSIIAMQEELTGGAA